MGRARKRRRSQGGVPAGSWERWQLLAASARIAAAVVEMLVGDHFPPRP
jgi:hypothetical protein